MNSNNPTLWRDTKNIVDALDFSHEDEMLRLAVRQKGEMALALNRHIAANKAFSLSIVTLLDKKKMESLKPLETSVSTAQKQLDMYLAFVNQNYREFDTVHSNQKQLELMAQILTSQIDLTDFYHVQLLGQQYQDWDKERLADQKTLSTGAAA
jgi:hypothetical protein